VIGFPHGGQVPAVKAFEASTALEHGAVVLDFVLNRGALVSGEDEAVVSDMLAVVEMAHSGMALAGVILEAGALDSELVGRACRLAARAGADYVVTSAGDEPATVTIERTALLHRALGGHLEVKAAGVFTDTAQLGEAVAAGASRVSTEFGRRLAREAAGLMATPERDSASPPLADVGVAAG
jgi:deoxyribose-phosphate aldolase